MVTTNTKGEIVVDAQIDSEEERKGRMIIYVVDSELKSILTRQNKLLKAILAVVAYGQNLSNNEEDYN